MFLLRTALLSIAIAAGQSAIAADLTCYVDTKTEAAKCINPKEVTESAGIRSTPLYEGGPKGVVKSAFTVAANCEAKVMHLKDRKGVSVGGGFFSATRMSRTLGSAICAASVTSKSAKK